MKINKISEILESKQDTKKQKMKSMCNTLDCLNGLKVSRVESIGYGQLCDGDMKSPLYYMQGFATYYTNGLISLVCGGSASGVDFMNVYLIYDGEILNEFDVF